MDCSLGAGGVVKSGDWSLECGVWRNAGREMGKAFLYREDLLKEHAKFQMKSSPNYFVVSISITIAPTANFAPIQLPHLRSNPIGPPRLDLHALAAVAALGGARKSGEYHRRTEHKFLRLRVAVNEAWK